jgi:hypothetical protein
MFTTLIGSTLLSAIIIAPPLVVHFVWYKPNPTEHRRYVDKNVQAWLFWVAANITISWFLALIVDVIPLLVQYFLVATWGHVSEAIKSRLEMYNAVKDTVKPAFYGASGIASWVIIFDHIYQLHYMDDDVTSAAPYTERVGDMQLPDLLCSHSFLFLLRFTKWSCFSSSSSSLYAFRRCYPTSLVSLSFTVEGL